VLRIRPDRLRENIHDERHHELCHGQSFRCRSVMVVLEPALVGVCSDSLLFLQFIADGPDGEPLLGTQLFAKFSYYEIYMGKVFDLLSDRRRLRVFEDSKVCWAFLATGVTGAACKRSPFLFLFVFVLTAAQCHHQRTQGGDHHRN